MCHSRNWKVAQVRARSQVLVYPNPAADVLYIQLDRDVPAGATLWVTGTVDRTTKELHVRKPAGKLRTLEADTHALAHGTYFVRMVQANGETSMVGAFLKL